MRKSIKQALSLLLVAAMLIACIPAVMAAEDQTSGTVPVAITASTPTFSVTVPTTLPIHMDAYGDITCGDITITNNSAGPVLVEDTQLTALNGWALVDYDTTTFLDTDKGQHRVALQLDRDNGVTAAGADIGEDFIPAGGGQQTVSVSVKLPYQGVEMTDATIAQVVFVLSWHRAGTPLEGLTITGNDSVGVGHQIQLTATKTPANTTDTETITWSSSDSSVATVSSAGVVTGKDVGTAVITASCSGVQTTHMVSVEYEIPSDFNENCDILFLVTGYDTDGTVSYKNTWCAYGMDYSGHRGSCSKYDTTLSNVVSESGTLSIKVLKAPSFLWFPSGWSFLTSYGSSCFYISQYGEGDWRNVTLTNSEGAFSGYISFQATGGTTQP